MRQVSPGRALVEVAGQTVEAHLRGGLTQGRRNSVHLLAVGDRVRIRRSDGPLVLVEEVLPRRNELARIDVGDKRGRRKQVLAANLDRIFVVVSLDKPSYNPRGVDRFLVLAASAGIPALFVLNKCDLREAKDGGIPAPEQVLGFYHDLGYEAVGTSAVTGEGLGDLRAALSGRRSFLLGPSGAGKSSLLNALYGLRPAHHRRQQCHLQGCPHDCPRGLGGSARGARYSTHRESGASHRGASTRDHLPYAFPEFRRAGPCRFGDCLHRGETGCAVEAATVAGEIPAQRLESYRRILETLPR